MEPSKVLSQFYCLLCQVYSSGEDCCRQHLAGKKHLAEVARRQANQASSTFKIPQTTLPCFDCDLIFTSQVHIFSEDNFSNLRRKIESQSSIIDFSVSCLVKVSSTLCLKIERIQYLIILTRCPTF